jgi:hypothetical protein
MDTTIDEDVVEQLVCNYCCNNTDESSSVSASNGDRYCDDCARICEHCDFIGHYDDDFQAVDGAEVWCQRCIERFANWCDWHDEYFTGYTYHAEDSSNTFCEDCYNNNTVFCEDCDASYVNGCDNDHDASRVIHDYSYRPDLIFHQTDDDTRLYFGIEIETEHKREDYSSRNEAAEYATRLEKMDLAYLKSDGSLTCGFEIVTHPMSHDFLMTEATDLWHTIETLKYQHEMISWGTRTCGVHVHISRTGFNGGAHQHRFLQLVYNNKLFYEVLAGRSSDRWASFDDVLDGRGNKRFMQKLTHGRDSNRYSAINTINRDTLEMRIFKGTLNVRTLKSIVNLAHASVEFTRDVSVPQVRAGHLNWRNLVMYVKSKPEIYSELIGKFDRVSNQLQAIERIEKDVSTSSVFA